MSNHNHFEVSITINNKAEHDWFENLLKYRKVPSDSTDFSKLYEKISLDEDTLDDIKCILREKHCLCYSIDFGEPEILARLTCAFLQQFNRDDEIELLWSRTGDEYGGGTYIITKNGYGSCNQVEQYKYAKEHMITIKF